MRSEASNILWVRNATIPHPLGPGKLEGSLPGFGQELVSWSSCEEIHLVRKSRPALDSFLELGQLVIFN